MAADRGIPQDRQHDGKVKLTKEDAKRIARGYNKSEHGSSIAYQCSYCGAWHTGHPRTLLRQSARKKR